MVYAVSGSGGFVFKEKLKNSKRDIKAWAGEKFGGLEKRIEELNEQYRKLDALQEERDLTESECTPLKESKAHLWQLKK